MKNKIILLLVLLIPSLCFGNSENYNYTKIVVDGTDINIPNPNGFIKATDLEYSKNLLKVMMQSNADMPMFQPVHFEHFISLSDAKKMLKEKDYSVEKSAYSYTTKALRSLKFSKNKFYNLKEETKGVLFKGLSDKKLKELYLKFSSNVYQNAKNSENFVQEKLDEAFGKHPKYTGFNETYNSLSYTEIYSVNGKARFTTIAIILVREKVIYLTFNASNLEESKLLLKSWADKVFYENK